MKKLIITVLTAISILPVHNRPSAQGFADSSWPMFGRDPAHTNRGPETPPATNTLKWTFRAEEGEFFGQISTGSDGTVYSGTGGANIDYGHLYAITPDGKLKWKFRTDESVSISVPAIGADGTIYIGSQDRHLYAINADGTLKWKYETNDQILSSPVIDHEGTIYIGSSSNNLYAFSPNGEVKWTYSAIRDINTPAVSNNGIIYFSDGNDTLYALTPDGNLLWDYFTDQSITVPSIGNDGTVIVCSKRYLFAFDPGGTLLWKKEIQINPVHSPSLAKDGTIYISPHYGCFSAINSDGTERWSFYRENTFFSHPAAIGSDGCLYLSGSKNVPDGTYITRNYIYAINPDGTLKWEALINREKGGIIGTNPVIGHDGTLYVSASERKYNENNNVSYTDHSYIYAFAPKIPTSVNEELELTTLELSPNPFNVSTTISFKLDTPSYVNIIVYSINGQKVAGFTEKTMSAGRHSFVFDGSNYASGMFLYRFESNAGIKTGKMLLMK